MALVADADTSSPARLQRQPIAVAHEAAIFVCAFLVYFGVRGLTEGDPSRAVQHARQLIDLERALGLYHEPWLQGLIVDHHWLVTAANWVYIWGHWPVIIGTGGWLLCSYSATYRLVRNTFLISGAIGLVIFATFPVAPPRLADASVVDTVTLHSNSYRVLQPPAFTNQYAAVPSLHFGWNMIIGMVIVHRVRRPLVRVFGLLLPVVMAWAVVFTANHFILDVVAGGAVALAGLWLAWILQQRARRLPAQPVAPAERGSKAA
jgi:membrane-associated phospholipid phosphatase